MGAGHESTIDRLSRMRGKDSVLSGVGTAMIFERGRVEKGKGNTIGGQERSLSETSSRGAKRDRGGKNTGTKGKPLSGGASGGEFSRGRAYA